MNDLDIKNKFLKTIMPTLHVAMHHTPRNTLKTLVPLPVIHRYTCSFKFYHILFKKCQDDIYLDTRKLNVSDILNANCIDSFFEGKTLNNLKKYLKSSAQVELATYKYYTQESIISYVLPKNMDSSMVNLSHVKYEIVGKNLHIYIKNPIYLTIYPNLPIKNIDSLPLPSFEVKKFSEIAGFCTKVNKIVKEFSEDIQSKIREYEIESLDKIFLPRDFSLYADTPRIKGLMNYEIFRYF